MDIVQVQLLVIHQVLLVVSFYIIHGIMLMDGKQVREEKIWYLI